MYLNITLKRVYNGKLIQTNLKKQSLKKLLLDICTKTLFIFNEKLYEGKCGQYGFTIRVYWPT